LYWLDLFIVIVLALFLFSGIKRGFFYEIAGLVGIVVGAVLTINFSDGLTRFLQNYINIASSLLFIVSIFLIFIVCLLGCKFLAWGLTKVVKSTPLSSINRLAGGIFSLLKGIVIISLALLLVLLLKPFLDLDSYVEDSSLGPPLRSVIPALFAYTSFLHPHSEDIFDKVRSAVKMKEVVEEQVVKPAEKVAEKAKKIKAPEFPQDEELLEGLKELFSRKEKE
jgi:membrane protein required for colicin V production